MKEILLLEKQVGETPLECLNRFRAAHAEYENVKMTYAGRLDPMARGLLVVLAGGMVFRKEEFLHLPKIYEATVILGVATDTFDVLGRMVGVRGDERVAENAKHFPPPSRHPGEGRDPGSENSEFQNERSWIPDNARGHRISGMTAAEITQILQSFIGTFSQKYPPYSSKTLGGKQLHELARENNLREEDLPSHDVTVFDVWDIAAAEISRSEISAAVVSSVAKIRGDFRQAETIADWESFSKSDSNELLQTVSFKISVSGGTYIRSIADELGKKMGCGACLWKLRRTAVGDFTLENKDF